MSNVKSVSIAGVVPFTLGESDEMLHLLGQLNLPSFNLRINWTGEDGYRPNEHGGKTLYYKFCIKGSEAVSWSWLDRLMQALVNVGAEFSNATAHDVEDGPKAAKLKIPIKQPIRTQ
jgi:hypothetical protein